MPETKQAWGRLKRNFGRMIQQKALSWALRWTPREDYETLVAFTNLLRASERDHERDKPASRRSL